MKRDQDIETKVIRFKKKKKTGMNTTFKLI